MSDLLTQIAAGFESTTVHHFQKLNHLFLLRPTEDALQIMLSVYGHQLEILEIFTASFALDLGEIVLLCPRLKTFSVHCCDFLPVVFNFANGAPGLRNVKIRFGAE